jgi:O-methyltransferase
MMSQDNEALIRKLHERIPLQTHLRALFGGRTIGSYDFLKLAESCRQATQTPIASWKALRRVERLWNLLRYALVAQAATSVGLFAECGVFRGFSALSLGHVMKAQQDAGRAEPREFWLVDSFEGLSEPGREDAVTYADGQVLMSGPSSPKGTFATPIRFVQERMAGYPFVKFAKGWIPDVYAQLPEAKWAFLHLDVDLYQPTADTLEYFYPRLVPGAVIVNDDFGSPLFPGAGKAWAEFFGARQKAFAILDSGQAIYIHE